VWQVKLCDPALARAISLPERFRVESLTIKRCTHQRLILLVHTLPVPSNIGVILGGRRGVSAYTEIFVGSEGVAWGGDTLPPGKGSWEGVWRRSPSLEKFEFFACHGVFLLLRCETHHTLRYNTIFPLMTRALSTARAERRETRENLGDLQ